LFSDVGVSDHLVTEEDGPLATEFIWEEEMASCVHKTSIVMATTPAIPR
jgi:hypothetical protein